MSCYFVLFVRILSSFCALRTISSQRKESVCHSFVAPFFTSSTCLNRQIKLAATLLLLLLRFFFHSHSEVKSIYVLSTQKDNMYYHNESQMRICIYLCWCVCSAVRYRYLRRPIVCRMCFFSFSKSHQMCVQSTTLVSISNEKPKRKGEPKDTSSNYTNTINAYETVN